MKLSTFITSATMAVVMSAGVAMAQTTPATKPMTAPSTTDKPMMEKAKEKMSKAKTKMSKMATTAKTRTAASMACSTDADAKGLKGKPRKAFRKTCMNAKKAMKN